MADEQKKDAVATPAAEGAPAEGAEASKKGLFANKMVLIGVVVCLVLAMGGGAAFFLLGAKKVEEIPLDPAAAIVMFDVPPIATNLLTNGGPSRFLKVKLALELNGEKDKVEVERMLPRLQDDWQNFLRQMRVEDTEGSAAMQRLKEALLLRANQVLAPVAVRNVLFRELLVQ
jgi:flagellar FliL protein